MKGRLHVISGLLFALVLLFDLAVWGGVKDIPHVGPKITETARTPEELERAMALGRVQFTITIPPGEQRPLVYCYEPVVVDETPDTDTLEFIYGCSVKRHILFGMAEEVVFSGLSRCDVPVELSVTRVNGQVVHYSQPAEETVTLVLPRTTEFATVRLVSLQGETVLQRSWRGQATTSLLLDVAEVAAGTYGLSVEFSSGTATSVVIIR